MIEHPIKKAVLLFLMAVTTGIASTDIIGMPSWWETIRGWCAVLDTAFVAGFSWLLKPPSENGFSLSHKGSEDDFESR